VWGVMKIADEGDGESLELGRPAAQSDLFVLDHRAVRFEDEGVGGNRGNSRSRSETEKFSSAEGKRRQ
jgi:hypothetical protein